MARNHPFGGRSDAGGTTRLATFIERTGIKPAVLARESGCSRQHLLRLRKGTMEPTRRVMVALAQACSRRLGRPVRVAELFDIGEHDVPPAAPPGLRS